MNATNLSGKNNRKGSQKERDWMGLLDDVRKHCKASKQRWHLQMDKFRMQSE